MSNAAQRPSSTTPMHAMARALAAGAAALAASAAFAQGAASPAGLWRSIDDETGQAKSLIRIEESGGTFSGRIEKILTDKPDAVCDLCTDARKGQRVQGMTIIEGMRAHNGTEPDLVEEEDRFIVRLWKEPRRS
mgnify:CR=1 FL=1